MEGGKMNIENTPNSEIRRLHQENAKKDTYIKELETKNLALEKEVQKIIKITQNYQSTVIIKNNKSTLWDAYYSWFISGRKNKVDEIDRKNNIDYISYYVKVLQEKLDSVFEELDKIRNEKNYLEKKINQNATLQAQLLQQADNKLQTVRKDLEVEATSYRNIIAKLSERTVDLENQLKISKDDHNDTQKSSIANKRTTERLKKELNEEKALTKTFSEENRQLEIKNSEFKQDLQQRIELLHTFKNRILTLESELKQERKKSKEVEEVLGNLRHTVKKEESELQPQVLQIYLNRISDTIQIVCEPVSQEINARQTEETFINNAFERIQKIQQDVNNYENQLDEFEGNRQSKAYLHIKEMLLRASEKLQSVESEHKKKIFTSRMEAVNRVKDLLKKLEQKVQQ